MADEPIIEAIKDEKEPGNYDDYATAFRLCTNARAVVMIVLDGHLGNGFSVQGHGYDIDRLPALLRKLATAIEEQRAQASTLQ